MKYLKNFEIVDDLEIWSNFTKHHISQDNLMLFAVIMGQKNEQQYTVEKDKRVGDSVKSYDSKRDKIFVSKNGNNHSDLSKREVYTADIDGYVPILFVIAIAIIIYYGKFKNKSSN